MPALHSFLIMALGQGGLVFAAAWAVLRLRHRTGRAARIDAMARCCGGLVALVLGGSAIGALIGWGTPAQMDRLGLGLVLSLAAVLGSILLAVFWTTFD